MAKEHVNKAIEIANNTLKDSEYSFEERINLTNLIEHYANENNINIEAKVGNIKNKLRLSGVSGVVLKQENKYTIVINSTELAYRQRFILAHEFAHIVLGHIKEEKHISFRIDINADLDNKLIVKKEEEEANAFAAEILMSEYYLRKVLEKNSSTSDLELAKHFLVSKTAIEIRRKYLGR